MTTVITRYFESAEHAKRVRFEMIHRERLPLRQIHYFASPHGVAEALTAARVDKTAAEAYEARLKDGGAVLMVEAGIKPLAMAKTTRDLLARMGATKIDGLVEEVTYKDPAKPKSSVLTDHPLLLSRPRDPMYDNVHMADWPIGLISRRKPFTYSVVPTHGRMASWPIGLLIPGHKYMAKWPIDHLIPGHKFQAGWPIAHLIPGHKHQAGWPIKHLIPGQPYMANWPIAHLIPGHKFQAGWPIKHLIPGKWRMANWPFPLLINGKTQTNSLVPGQKYMANWPIDHLIPGQPYQANFPFGHIIPGHKHQADFPIPLISKRKPYTKSVIGKHARTADVVLPLVLKDRDTSLPDKGKRFSLSALLGMPTVIRR